MNYVSLIGRLVRDPELKYSSSGKAYCTFTVAVTREYNRNEADFINCVAWEKRAETIAEYMRKGNRIALQGRINVSSYEQNGEKRWKTDVLLEKFEFIDNNSNNQNTNSYSQQVPQNNSFNNNDSEEIMDDDDFPF